MSKPPPWADVVVFDRLTVPEFTKVINRHDREILNWATFLPQTVFIASNLHATSLADFLREQMPEIRRLIVLDADTDRNGWLPESAWGFLREPGPPKKKAK